MPEPLGEQNIDGYLTAFADGELDAAQNIQVLNYLTSHPAALRLMLDQQQLRVEAQRAIRGRTPGVPDALRQRIEALAASITTDAPAASARAPTGGAGSAKWRMAAAAMLLIGITAGGLAGRFLLRPTPPATVAVIDRPVPVERPAPVIPASLLSAATRVHVDCSRLAERLHGAGYPPAFLDLAAAVKADVGVDSPRPDLSSIGFRFVGAGPCGRPLEGTIHLLYRSTEVGSVAGVSVFVQRNAGQLPLQPGNLYTASGPDAPFPMLAWRTERVVYFLLADDAETADRARRAIGGAPNP